MSSFCPYCKQKIIKKQGFFRLNPVDRKRYGTHVHKDCIFDAIVGRIDVLPRPKSIQQVVAGGCHKCGNDIVGNLVEGACVECKIQYWFTPCYDEDDILRAILKEKQEGAGANEA